MKNSRILLLGAALLAAACTTDKASVDFTVADAPSSSLVLKQLEGTVANVLDTVKTDAAGHFRYDVKVEAGQPEFIYVFKGDRRIASLLVEKGEKAVVSADTLGNYEVSGSEGSVLLKQGDDAFRTYVSRLYALAASGAPQSEINKEYVSHYRNSTRFVATPTPFVPMPMSGRGYCVRCCMFPIVVGYTAPPVLVPTGLIRPPFTG